MKRSSSGTEAPPAKQRKVKHETFKKWTTQYDQEWQKVTWLDCETVPEGGTKLVVKLKCKVCRKYKIVGRRNFSEKWISGAESVKTTNIVDHAKSDQHIHAMNLHKKELALSKNLSVASYAPIAQSMNTLPDDERSKLKVKFDIAYFVATEQLAYCKYPKICELEARHGVMMGNSYLHENAAKEFTHFISESRKQSVLSSVSNANFFLFYWMVLLTRAILITNFC